MNDLLKAAIDAAVNAISDKNESVKDDIKEHLATSVLVGEEVEKIAGQIGNMITTLGGQFEKMSLQQSRLTGYILETLDLPRHNLSLDAVNDLIHLTTEARKHGGIAVAPSKLGMSTLPNNGVVVKHEGDDEDAQVTHTVIYVKTSETKFFLFLLTDSIETYEVKRVGENLLIEKVENFSSNQLGAALEEIKDTQFAPALMSDREIVTIDELDESWAEAYLLDHPEVLENENNLNERTLLDIIVKAYVTATNLGDISKKRVELEHHEELTGFVNMVVNQHTAEAPELQQGEEVTPAAVEVKESTASIDELNQVEDATVIPVDETENDSLFSEGVTEQPEGTVTPEEEEDFFGDDVVEESSVETDSTYSDLTTTEHAIKILKELGDNPERGLSIIKNTPSSIKDSIYRTVLNTLPSVQKRSAASYTTEEKDAVMAELEGELRPVLAKIEEYRIKIEKERLEALKYKPEMVVKHIEDNPVHAHLVPSAEHRQEIAESVSRYLNDNDRETDDNSETRIAEVLRNISLYSYDTEAIINPTFRVSNFPPKDSLIRATPVISTTLRKLYVTVKGWDDSNSNLLKGCFDKVFNGELSGLDLGVDVVGILVDGTLPAKNFTRVGGYIVASVPVKAEDTAACIVVMSASQAHIFNIDRVSKKSVGTSEITRPQLRNNLLNLLMYR